MTIGWDGKVYGAYSYLKPGDRIPTYSDVTDYLKPSGQLTYNELMNGYDLMSVIQSLKIKQ